VERDEAVRMACFLALDVLRAEFGDDVPYRGGLDRGFAYHGLRVPFLNYQKGIYRAGVQRGPAALSINTSSNSPYDDEETDLGFLYAYRAGPLDQPDNRALRACRDLAAPLAYFVGTRPGWYRPLYPCFVIGDEPAARRVLVTVGTMAGPLDEREPVLPEDPIERRYAVRETRVRLHQARFRGRVLPAYLDQCAICRLKEVRLLDAAHIVADLEPTGIAAVSNGLSLCSIHHRAFDEDLVGIDPTHTVHVARRLRDDEDGPMLDVLKSCHGTVLRVPNRRALRPDGALLEARFARFEAAA
jgi:putative restriction endonuclease